MKALRNVRWYVRRPDAGVERGTNVVESAVMVSLLFLVLLGILEAAMLMTNRSNVKSSVNLAVRSGSVAANDPDADYVILRDLGKLLGDQVPSVRYVIVFQANSVLAGQVPASCVASANTGGSGVAGLCNVYWPSVLRNPVQSQFGFDPITNATATADQSWPAVSRLATYSGGRDLLGVFVASTHRSVTGLIPRLEMNSVSIVRLEARGV